MLNLNLITLLLFNIIVLFSINTNADGNYHNTYSQFKYHQQHLNNRDLKDDIHSKIPELFIAGIKDSIETISGLYISIIFIGIMVEQQLITYTDKLFINISNFWLKHIVNIIYLSLLVPLVENVISHIIIYSTVEKAYQKITPDALNNKSLDDNIPRIHFDNMPIIQEKIDYFYRKIKQESFYNPKSSSFAIEFLSKLTLATCYLLIYIINKELFSGAIKTISAIKRTPYYKTHGYTGVVAYQAGFNTCLYLSFAIFMFFGLNFMNYFVN